jgi:hypothetical protein
LQDLEDSLESKALMVKRVRKATQAFRVPRVHRVIKEPEDLLDLRVHRVLREHKDCKVRQEPLAHRDLEECEAFKVSKDLKVRLALRVQQEPQV